jgi:mRNA interferase HicA
MKRAELLRHLAAHGCQLFREGGRHSIDWNPANRKTIS